MLLIPVGESSARCISSNIFSSDLFGVGSRLPLFTSQSYHSVRLSLPRVRSFSFFADGNGHSGSLPFTLSLSPFGLSPGTTTGQLTNSTSSLANSRGSCANFRRHTTNDSLGVV